MDTPKPMGDSKVKERTVGVPPAETISTRDHVITTPDFNHSFFQAKFESKGMPDSFGGANDFIIGGTDQVKDTKSKAGELSFEQSEQLQRMKSDISKYGEKPTAGLANLMRDNQVVGIGDGHGPNEPLEINARDYLKALKDGGATHLVIETPPSCNDMLDEFNRSGKLDESKLPILSQDNNYVSMLKKANALGLKVVGGDSEHATSDQADRNPTMASTIENIINQPGQDPQHPNKVAFWVGGQHLADYHRSPTSQNMTAAELLRKDHVKLATVAYQRAGNDSPIERSAASVIEPTMLSTTKAKSFEEYDKDNPFLAVKNSGDYLILYPPN